MTERVEQLAENEWFFIKSYRALDPTYKALFNLALAALTLLNGQIRELKERIDGDQ